MFIFFFFKHIMKKGNDHLIYFNTVMVLYFCIVEFSASNIQIDISRRRGKKKIRSNDIDDIIIIINKKFL